MSVELGHDRSLRSQRFVGIYALVEPERAEPIAFTRALVAGGVRIIQIRAKNGIATGSLTTIVELVRAAGGMTLVNDDVEAALLADGVHLGQEDAALLDLPELRRRLGARYIGLSCGTSAEARAVDPALIDYLGVGPMFATRSKSDAGEPLGVDGVRAVVAASPVPVAAIGGIDLTRLPRVRETRAAMAALISALTIGPDVAATARAFVTAWSG